MLSLRFSSDKGADVRPKWLLLMVPVLIGIAALLLYGVGSPSNAAVARVFSAGQWKVAAQPGDPGCSLVADLELRGGPIGRAVAELIERLHETRVHWSGAAKAVPLCPYAAEGAIHPDRAIKVGQSSRNGLPF